MTDPARPSPAGPPPGRAPRDAARADPPRALSLHSFQFNFRVGVAEQIAARYGAPAFAERARKLEEALDGFWGGLARKYEQLWIAAGEGRIDDDGREIRQALLDAGGRDRLAERDHRKRLHAERVDESLAQAEAFNRAWRRHVRSCGLEALQRQHDDFRRYYPIEANLATDPETGAFLWEGRRWTPPVAPTLDAVLARFPLR